MKPTPELINDWHEKARQMALQADGYFDDVEHWRHFAELAAAWGAEKARQTTDPLGFQIRRAIAAEDELRATKQTLEHAYAALQKVADAQAAIEEPELPEPFAVLHHDDGYFTTKQREHDLRYGGPIRTDVYTAVQMHDHFAAGVRVGAAGIPWQPIASAPQDGTKVLAYTNDGCKYPLVCQCVWGDGAWWPDVWESPAEPLSPTHWMPLPTPPAMQGGQK